jgi:hypothetical protein
VSRDLLTLGRSMPARNLTSTEAMTWNCRFPSRFEAFAALASILKPVVQSGLQD